MLAALALITALAGPTTVELIPTDDIWVYPHASDQKDPFLRVWGVGGTDVAKDADELQQCSYSYLKFDVSKLPAGKITGATLTVTHMAGAGFTDAAAKQTPLRVRPLPFDFTEKEWEYSKTDKVVPPAGDKNIFGAGVASIPAKEAEFPISVDLLMGPNDFRAYIDSAKASSSKSLGLALTAAMDVEQHGQRYIYKFYSKDNEKPERRPVLKLTIEKLFPPDLNLCDNSRR